MPDRVVVLVAPRDAMGHLPSHVHSRRPIQAVDHAGCQPGHLFASSGGLRAVTTCRVSHRTQPDQPAGHDRNGGGHSRPPEPPLERRPRPFSIAKRPVVRKLHEVVYVGYAIPEVLRAYRARSVSGWIADWQGAIGGLLCILPPGLILGPRTERNEIFQRSEPIVPLWSEPLPPKLDDVAVPFRTCP